MFQQLRAGNTYTSISWQFLFDVMKQYCARYTAVADEQVGYKSEFLASRSTIDEELGQVALLRANVNPALLNELNNCGMRGKALTNS